MALVAWYKLNGNVLDSTVNGNHGTIVGSPTVVSDGPFGTCYLFNPDTNDRINISNLSQFIYNTPFTFSAWIKTSGLGTGQTVNGIVSLTYGSRFFSDSAGNICISFVSTNIGFYSITSSGVNINDNVWHHVCCTYNGDVLKLYIDGILNVTGVTGIIQTNTYTNNGAIGLDVNDSSKYKFNGSISDVRIYDEALSLKEIKELSKAKVLHYDFNQFQEPTTNLLYDNETINWTISNLTATVARTTIVENQRYKINSGASAGAFRLSVPLSKLTNGLTYNLSFKYKINTGTAFNMTDWCDMSLFNVVNIDYSEYKYSSACSFKATYDSTYRFMDFYISGSSEVEIWDIQLEAKDHATPFVNGTRAAQVYDKSGYDNNAELAVSTTPTYINESIVNKGCYEFSSGKYINTTLSPNSIKTISFWFKNNTNASNSIMIGSQTPSNARFYVGWSSSKLNGGYGNKAWTLPTNISYIIGEWHHVVMSYDKVTAKLYYDGELLSEKTDSIYTESTGIFRIGQHSDGSNQYLGSIADVRFYSTALSEDDIKEIYQTRASIDKNGNLYCNNIEENKYINPIVDYTSWVVGTSGAQTGFDLNGATSENYIIESSDPFNNIIPIWEARPEGISGADGGWVTSSFNIDNTKLYRFSVWVRRTVIGNGTFYLGVYGYGSTSGVYTLANVNNTNPYFYYSSNLFTNRQDQWLLVVGYVYPYTYTGTTSPADSGVYNVDGTKIVASTTSFKWRPETTTAKHRSYLFYSTNIDTRQQWCYPRVDICDGTEPTIVDLLNGIDYKHYQITKDLISSKGINKNSSVLSNEFSEVGITEGLVAYYPLNGDAKDYSGNNNHGTIYGAIKASGIAGKKCYYFDGTDDYIDCTTTPLITSNSFSISLWFNKLSIPATYSRLITLATYLDSFGLGISDSTTYLGLYFGSTSNFVRLKTSSVPNNNEWYHVVLTCNGDVTSANSYNIYLNKAVLSTTSTSTFSACDNKSIIGARRVSTTPGYYFNGKIQDVRIYNRALSDKEIGILYNTFNPNINKTLQINKENIIYTKGNIKEV